MLMYKMITTFNVVCESVLSLIATISPDDKPLFSSDSVCIHSVCVNQNKRRQVRLNWHLYGRADI